MAIKHLLILDHSEYETIKQMFTYKDFTLCNTSLLTEPYAILKSMNKRCTVSLYYHFFSNI
jgi:hypothetical protein